MVYVGYIKKSYIYKREVMMVDSKKEGPTWKTKKAGKYHRKRLDLSNILEVGSRIVSLMRRGRRSKV